MHMVIGITMVKVMPGQERLVYCSFNGKDGILDVYHIFGEYDFFLVLQADSLVKLKELMEDIQYTVFAQYSVDLLVMGMRLDNLDIE